MMGPSGCGKLTLLHLLGGLDRADAGTRASPVSSTRDLFEADWAMRRCGVGSVFQAFHLVDELIVAGYGSNGERCSSAGAHRTLEGKLYPPFLAELGLGR